MSACPAWCDARHATDYPVHGRDVGAVEVDGTAFDVALFQNGDADPQVALYVHTGSGGDGETLAVHLAPGSADGLRAALAAALATLGGAA